MKMKQLFSQVTVLGLACIASLGHSAVTLDRTRVIFDGSGSSVSITVSNKNKNLPYLAQAWMENAVQEKENTPFVVLPPLQRLEPNQSSQVRIEALENKIAELPQDRESLFYFNLREVPPKSDKPNVLQIALQSKIKLFYRPASLMLAPLEMSNNPWQEKLTLVKQGNQVIAKNPTAYYTTIISVRASKDSKIHSDLDAVMIAPFSEEKLPISAQLLGNSPVLTYINDYGGTPKLQYQCQVDTCQVIKAKKE
ncbi:molecular chaperone [Acinetobacter sp. ANC 4558]|nr:molecular chaperone [Acinetobacter sp. ANC 4558]